MSSSRCSENAKASARLEAQKQWNASPCGALATTSHDAAYFVRVEADRYRQQYWQRDFFDFTSFRGKRVLEIGPGLGTDLKQFARNGAECFGVDITDAHLQMTRINFENEGFKVDLRKCDATNLPFPNEYFDCVYTFGVLHHIPDLENVLTEIHRVLKPGGVMQCAVYHLRSIHTWLFFIRAALNGTLRNVGVSGVLARIEKGADGVDIKPYVKLYSRREWIALVDKAGLCALRVEMRQVNFERHKFLNVFRPFERWIGWYVCGQFRRRPES
jgi:ubiquinone/menaquinone biosynthesis C-methylase UbiE